MKTTEFTPIKPLYEYDDDLLENVNQLVDNLSSEDDEKSSKKVTPKKLNLKKIRLPKVENHFNGNFENVLSREHWTAVFRELYSV